MKFKYVFKFSTPLTIVTFHPLAIAWNVFGVKELGRWRIFAQAMVGR